MWTRAELKGNARNFFQFNYWKMVLVGLVLAFINGSGTSVGNSSVRNAAQSDYYRYMPPSFLLSVLVMFSIFTVLALGVTIFLFHPLEIGAQRFFVVSHYQKAELGELGYGFSHSYMNIVKTMFLKQLYIFLWTLLFIVPGIIKGYEYRMIPYILAENPEISSREAFDMSRQMMDGNKWAAFVLDLSFLGWMILSVFTCGILAIFYVNPYVSMTGAELYVALKEITFGGRGQGWDGQGYQNNQSYQNGWYGQGYQNEQSYQNGWDGQGYQNSQSYQNGWDGQGYQNDQSYQNGWDGQGYQTGQSNQNGWDGQAYQNDQNYQNNVDSYTYQNGGDNQI